MKKVSADPKVKKTFVRHSENNVYKTNQVVFRDPSASSSKSVAVNPVTGQELTRPTLCSSEALANYLSEAKHCIQVRPLIDDIKADKVALSAKVTRKLNFHFNDRIYNNLVELNSDAADLKKRDRKVKITTNKRDLEPNIDDFCHSEIERDFIPNIPVIKPKLKFIRNIESGKLHNLVSSFEVL